jgi:hypothetical protein
MRNPDMGSFVDNYYSVAKFQAAYAGIIPSITDRNQWPEDNKGFKVHPPVQKKREPGRLRKNRIKPAREGGKATRQVRCPNCKEYGHRASSWKCPHTGTKKRWAFSHLCSIFIFYNILTHAFSLVGREQGRLQPKLGGRRPRQELVLMQL